MTSSFGHTTTAVWQMSTAQSFTFHEMLSVQCSAVSAVSGAVAEISTSTIDIRYNRTDRATHEMIVDFGSRRCRCKIMFIDV